MDEHVRGATSRRRAIDRIAVSADDRGIAIDRHACSKCRLKRHRANNCCSGTKALSAAAATPLVVGHCGVRDGAAPEEEYTTTSERENHAGAARREANHASAIVEQFRGLPRQYSSALLSRYTCRECVDFIVSSC